MDANVKRTLTAALRAAESVTKADEKLATCTATFIKSAGGFDQATKLLGAQRAEGRTWKQEREENSPLWRVYNCVAVAKSRANPRKRGARQTGKAAAGKAGKAAAGEAGKAAAGEAGKAGTPASDADVLGHVLQWGADRIAKAVQDQTAVLDASAIDVLTAVLGILINQAPAPAPRAPAKRAPAKRAPAKRATK